MAKHPRQDILNILYIVLRQKHPRQDEDDYVHDVHDASDVDDYLLTMIMTMKTTIKSQITI